MALPDLISSRTAEAQLALTGVARRQARRVLAAGFAGRPVVTSGALLYPAAAVAELTRRPVIPETTADTVCPSGVFVARRDVDLLAPRHAQLDELRDGWDLSPWTRVWIRVVCERDGRLPLVATVGGFVGLGAEITGVMLVSERRCRLDLRDPGPWFDSWRSGRFPAGPGRDWVIRGLPWSSAGSADRRAVGE